MAYSGPYGPPQIDFSGLDPIGSFEKGAQIRRGYTARSELAKCAPDDFACMSKVLMQLDPAEGVRLAQLQNQLQHQSFQEDLATKQLEQSTRTADALAASRIGGETRRQETYDAPFKALETGIPGYATARDALMSNRAGGVLESGLGGAPIKEIMGFAGKVADAQHLKGEARKAYVIEHTPGAYDFARGRAAEMFNSLEADAKGLGFEVPAYVEKVAPPPPANSPAAAGRGAPGLQQPPVTVSPPGLNQEGASAAEGPAARPVPTVTIRLVPGTNIQIPPALANKHLTYDRQDNTFIDKDTGERFNINGEPVSGQ